MQITCRCENGMRKIQECVWSVFDGRLYKIYCWWRESSEQTHTGRAERASLYLNCVMRTKRGGGDGGGGFLCWSIFGSEQFPNSQQRLREVIGPGHYLTGKYKICVINLDLQLSARNHIFSKMWNCSFKATTSGEWKHVCFFRWGKPSLSFFALLSVKKYFPALV